MDWGLVLGLIVTALAAYLVRQVLAWLSNLDMESAELPAEHHFEDATSLERVPAPSIFADATKALSVVIPAYNEEERLPPMLEEMLAFVQKRRDRQGPQFTYEIIVVDDGSSDGTGLVAMEYVRRCGLDAVRLLQLPRNRGKGFAVKAGVMCARGELILMADADGATPAAEEQRLEDALRNIQVSSVATGQSSAAAQVKQPSSTVDAAGGMLGMAVASRSHMQQQATAKRHWLRNFLMHGFHMLVTFVIGGAVKDTQCGFKLFTRRAAALLFTNMHLQRWCFDVELIYLAQRFSIPVAEVPVTWTEIPGSKIKVTSMIHMAWELLSILAGYSIMRIWPLRTPADSLKPVR